MGPQIRTERTVLRLPELRDAPALSRFAGDIDVAKMTSRIPSPYPLISAEIWVLQTRARQIEAARRTFVADFQIFPKQGFLAALRALASHTAPHGSAAAAFFAQKMFDGHGLASSSAGFRAGATKRAVSSVCPFWIATICATIE